MPIEIHVNPARLERVVFTASSEMEDDFTHAAWLAIRPLVKQIDRRLRALAREVCEGDAPGTEPRTGGPRR